MIQKLDVQVYRTRTHIVITGSPDEGDPRHHCDEMGCQQEHVLYRFLLPEREATILKAAENADDNLDGLLQEAIELMDEAQAERLMDKVHQVQSEALRDLQGWKESEET